VFVCLKVSFAKSVTLGNSLGDTLNRSLQHYLQYFIINVLSLSNIHWEIISPIFSFLIHSITITIAYLNVRIIAGYQAAICGSALVANGLNKYVLSSVISDKSHLKLITDSFTAIMVVYALGYQVSTALGYHPFVQTLISPLILVESLLSSLASSHKS
jgi:hypothetical protein